MGRIPSGKVPPQAIKAMQERHFEIMRRLIAGETQHKIALELGMSETRLSVVCNSPIFQQELIRRRGDVDKRFNETTGDIKARINNLQSDAVDVLELIVKKDKDNNGFPVPLRLKREVAIDILDIAGSGAKKTKDSSTDDIIKLISEGFKVAQENRKMELEIERDKRNERIISTDIDYTVMDTSDNGLEAGDEQSADSSINSLVPYQSSVELIERVS
jgi:hypothetical protein